MGLGGATLRHRTPSLEYSSIASLLVVSRALQIAESLRGDSCLKASRALQIAESLRGDSRLKASRACKTSGIFTSKEHFNRVAFDVSSPAFSRHIKPCIQQAPQAYMTSQRANEPTSLQSTKAIHQALHIAGNTSKPCIEQALQAAGTSSRYSCKIQYIFGIQALHRAGNSSRQSR